MIRPILFIALLWLAAGCEKHEAVTEHPITYQMSAKMGLAEDQQSAITVFPNPFVQRVMIHIPVSQPSTITMLVTSPDGKHQKVVDGEQTSAGASFTLNFYDRKQGIYLCEIIVNDVAIRHHLIKVDL